MKGVVAAALAALTVAPGALAAPPVPSLTPTKTRALWRAEVARARAPHRALSSAADCRPARVVFYAQTDWLRLATTLAATPSPCADYYVSVPPLAADKTQARSGQASQIRALGPQFHAVDEISYAGWSSWVASTGSSWYQAGVTARQRMAAAGFDTSAGDTWALNEASSAVRTNTGQARQNLLDFLSGLASDGVKGIVFVAGIGQPTAPLSTYKVNLQDWLQDDPFWTQAADYVSDWAQEDYGDVRDYAAAGTTPQQRIDATAQYLGHELALANAGPSTAAAARSLLDSEYVAFGNAAWAWSSAYGWTDVPVATMEDYVSGQIDAARQLDATAGMPLDRFGFAWAPTNTQGLSSTDFDNQTASILARIASAVQTTGDGTAACDPAWCTTTLDGAALVPAWADFASWSPTVPAFASAPATTQAGTPTGALSIEVQTDGVVDPAPTARTVTLSTSSPTGAFAATATGPWTPTLTLTIPAGSSTVSFVYSDAGAGSPVLTATLDDGGTATQVETVQAQPAPQPAPPTTSTTIAAPPTTTTVAPPPNVTPVTEPRPVQPKPAPPKPRVTRIRTARVHGYLVVTVTVAAGTRRVRDARVLIRVRRGSSVVAHVLRVTTRSGVATWRSAHRLPAARYLVVAALRSTSTA